MSEVPLYSQAGMVGLITLFEAHNLRPSGLRYRGTSLIRNIIHYKAASEPSPPL